MDDLKGLKIPLFKRTTPIEAVYKDELPPPVMVDCPVPYFISKHEQVKIDNKTIWEAIKDNDNSK